VISGIDIWRAPNLMLKRYGEKALEESSARADELAVDGDHDGATNLAPDFGCRRAIREQHAARTRPLNRNGPVTAAGWRALSG
jgi:hypothetical protein